MAKINVVCKNKKNYKAMKELLDDRGYSFKKDKENLTLIVKKTNKSEMKDLANTYNIFAKIKKIKEDKEKEAEAPEIPALDNTQDENPFVAEERDEEDVEVDEEEYDDDEEEMEEEEEMECE